MLRALDVGVGSAAPLQRPPISTIRPGRSSRFTQRRSAPCGSGSVQTRWRTSTTSKVQPSTGGAAASPTSTVAATGATASWHGPARPFAARGRRRPHGGRPPRRAAPATRSRSRGRAPRPVEAATSPVARAPKQHTRRRRAARGRARRRTSWPLCPSSRRYGRASSYGGRAQRSCGGIRDTRLPDITARVT